MKLKHIYTSTCSYKMVAFLTKIFNKLITKSKCDEFLQVCDELNERDCAQDIVDLKHNVIAQLDTSVESSIQQCTDARFLADINYLLLMYCPPTTAYKKVQARLMLARLIKAHCNHEERIEVLTYIIEKFHLDA